MHALPRRQGVMGFQEQERGTIVDFAEARILGKTFKVRPGLALCARRIERPQQRAYAAG